GAVIRAVPLPDTLAYVTVADSAGGFRLGAIPPGRYHVWAIQDQNANRLLDRREAFDTVTVTVDTSATAVLWAFVHDTVGPRVKSVDLVDTVTLRLTFTEALDPRRPVDTGAVRVLALPDSTPVAVAAVFTLAQFDSLQARARAAADSLRRLRDTTARRDTAALRPPPPPAPAPALAAPHGGRRHHAPAQTAAAAARPLRPPGGAHRRRARSRRHLPGAGAGRHQPDRCGGRRAGRGDGARAQARAPRLDPPAVTDTDPRRRLPAVDALLAEPDIAALVAAHPRSVVVRAAREALDAARAAGGTPPAEGWGAAVLARVHRLTAPSLEPLVNA